MAKQNKGRRRRKNSKHYSDSDDEHWSDNTENNGRKDVDSKSPKNAPSKSELSFAEKRENQRKAAAEKRRQKMKVCTSTVQGQILLHPIDLSLASQRTNSPSATSRLEWNGSFSFRNETNTILSFV